MDKHASLLQKTLPEPNHRPWRRADPRTRVDMSRVSPSCLWWCQSRPSGSCCHSHGDPCDAASWQRWAAERSGSPCPTRRCRGRCRAPARGPQTERETDRLRSAVTGCETLTSNTGSVGSLRFGPAEVWFYSSYVASVSSLVGRVCVKVLSRVQTRGQPSVVCLNLSFILIFVISLTYELMTPHSLLQIWY